MSLTPLWVKALIAAIVAAALIAAFYSWRSSIKAEGYDDAVAIYKPKLAKLDAQLADWQAANTAWQASFEVLKRGVEEQAAASKAASEQAAAKHKATKAALEAEKAKSATARETAEHLAHKIETLQLPGEQHDAITAVIRAARDSGL